MLRPKSKLRRARFASSLTPRSSFRRRLLSYVNGWRVPRMRLAVRLVLLSQNVSRPEVIADARRQLQKKFQDDELKSTTSAAAESGRVHIRPTVF
jgi:hypothetical protein